MCENTLASAMPFIYSPMQGNNWEVHQHPAGERNYKAGITDNLAIQTTTRPLNHGPKSRIRSIDEANDNGLW